MVTLLLLNLTQCPANKCKGTQPLTPQAGATLAEISARNGNGDDESMNESDDPSSDDDEEQSSQQISNFMLRILPRIEMTALRESLKTVRSCHFKFD
jgi:hypothetical protein